MEQPHLPFILERTEEASVLDQISKSEVCKEEHQELISSDDDYSSQDSLPSSSHPLDVEIKSSKLLYTTESDTSSKVKMYEACAWVDLPNKVREAATRLGYSEEIWNRDHEDESREVPESSKKYWVELSTEEIEAAKTLGYDEVHWDFGDKEITPEDYDDMYWNQLPKHIRKAYRVLGYRKSVWNEDESPASFDKDWFELTEAEQKAATIVGYTAETWDEDPGEDTEESITKATIYFSKGSCYILLECISMSAFFAIIKAFFSFGKRFLEGNALGAFKIFTGLFIMFFSGQTHRWLMDDEEEPSNRSTRRNRMKQQTPLFQSFLNLFSWWAIFAGVDHFMEAFENEVLYNYSDSAWYLKMCEEPENVTSLMNATNATNVGNTTFALFKDRFDNITDMIEDMIEDFVCEVLDDEQERMGPVYYSTVFIGSAVILWFSFEDNFLTGCDVE